MTDFFPLPPSSLPAAARLYARAFSADPLMVHYLPDPAVRAQALPAFMHVALRYTHSHGEVWAAQNADGLAGVACWLPPGHWELSAWGMVRSALGVVTLGQAWQILRSFTRSGARGSFLGQVSAMESKIDRIHRTTLPVPHWYLMILGVDPACQGQGIGSRLIAPQLARARAAGLPCYLETMLERDVAFYRKNGFTVAYDADLLPGGLHVWAMVYESSS